MTNLKSKLSIKALSLLLVTGLMSCSEDNNDLDNSPVDQGRLSVSANATFSGTTNRNTVDISKFLINLEEIELEYENGNYGSDDEIELQGPFEIDVLAGATFLSFDIPQGNYDELSFEFDDNENPSSQLYDKTVLIEGTVNGTPFVFWYYFEAEKELYLSNGTQNIDINAGLNNIIISFDLDNILAQVDLSQASDTDQDGVIEIDSNNNDGNLSIATQFKDALINSANLEEDDDDDDNDDD